MSTLDFTSNTNYYSIFFTWDSEDARAQLSHHTALAEVKITSEAVEPVPSVGSKRRGSADDGNFGAETLFCYKKGQETRLTKILDLKAI
jgi:hypothetical protein